MHCWHRYMSARVSSGRAAPAWSTQRSGAPAQALSVFVDRMSEQTRTWVLVTLFLVGFALLLRLRLNGSWSNRILMGATTTLWLGGILLPMLSVLAQIEQVELVIGGVPIVFNQNVLFYQEKKYPGICVDAD